MASGAGVVVVEVHSETWQHPTGFAKLNLKKKPAWNIYGHNTTGQSGNKPQVESRFPGGYMVHNITVEICRSNMLWYFVTVFSNKMIRMKKQNKWPPRVLKRKGSSSGEWACARHILYNSVRWCTPVHLCKQDVSVSLTSCLAWMLLFVPAPCILSLIAKMKICSCHHFI